MSIAGLTAPRIDELRLTLRYCEVLVAIGVVITSLEQLVRIREYTPGGFFSWRINRLRWPLLANDNLLAHGLGKILSSPLIAIIFASRLFCSVAILSLRDPPGLLHLSIVALALLLHIAAPLGGDGSDQMTTIVLAAVGVARLPIASALAGHVCAMFIAAESILSYVTSGVAKAISSGWRRGIYLPLILRTRAYGHPGFALWLARHRGLSAFLSISVIVLETAFPVFLALPPRPAAAVVVLAGTMHGSIAVVMGLNVFFWAFVSSYPALWYAYLCVRQ